MWNSRIQSDVFYQNTNGTSVNTSEIQSVVLGPQTFNGQSAIQTTTLLISAGGTQTSFSYAQVQGLNVLTLGSVTTIAANYTVTSVHNPPLHFSYSLASGQSIATTGTLTSTTVIGVLSTSSTYPSTYTYTFNGFEDVTVPAGTFAGACKWTVSSTVNGIANTGTMWITRKGILVKTVAGASISVLTSGTLNGGPVGP